MGERLFLRLDGDPVYAPETTVPDGTMRGFAVQAPLAEHVAHIVSYEEAIAEGAELVERVLPDGAVRLIFVARDGGWFAAATGATQAPAIVRLSGHMQGLSVTLRLGAAAAVLGLPAGELRGATVALDELWRAPELMDQLAAAQGSAACAAVVQRALRHRLRHAESTAPRQAAAAARLVAHTAGRASVRSIADAMGIGERRLQQLFAMHVGLTPAALARVARMHACLKALRRHPAPRWAELAVDMGFYDQSHLANEFKSLCGLSPSLFLAHAGSFFSKTSD